MWSIELNFSEMPIFRLMTIKTGIKTFESFKGHLFELTINEYILKHI